MRSMLCLLTITVLVHLVCVTAATDLSSQDFRRNHNKQVTNVAVVRTSGSYVKCAALCFSDDLCPGFNVVRTGNRASHCELVTNEEDYSSVSLADSLDTDYYAKVISPDLLTMAGVTCTASSNSDRCSRAYDGLTTGGSINEWVSVGEGAGAWLQVTFPRTVRVESLQLWQRCDRREQYSRFRLRFSDGSEQEILAPCSGSLHHQDCASVSPVFHQLTHVLTSSVRITGCDYGLCGAQYIIGGIREMKINGE